MSNWEILQALVFEPRKAFAELSERPKFWFPLLLLIIATTATTLWYTSVVDIGWVTDRDLRHSMFASRLTEEQITQQVQNAQQQRGLRATIGVIGTVIVIPVVMMITALYNLLVGKMFGFERGFRQWFSFCSWTSLPSALAVIPAALVLATTETTQIGQEALQTLSLNALFFHRAVGEPGFSLLNALNLIQLVTLYLSILGVKVWSGRSWLFSVLFIGIPWLVIYGIWARISLS
jgi:hypothetical protein